MTPYKYSYGKRPVDPPDAPQLTSPADVHVRRAITPWVGLVDSATTSPSGITHGLAGYKSGCRCGICRQEKSDANRRYVDKLKAEGRPRSRPAEYLREWRDRRRGMVVEVREVEGCLEI